jgi:hypothetical protein
LATTDDIDGVTINLDADGRPLLFVLLTEDGTINRMGNGRLANDELDLYAGHTDEPLLGLLRRDLPDDILEHAGSYEVPGGGGIPIRLAIGFKLDDGSESGLEFTYGSESEGPPQDVVDIVRRARELTDPWYREQRAATGAS